MVSWEKITRPKKDGGLGIRSAREADTALLGKLVWDIQQHHDKLLVNMISNKYLSAGSVLTNQGRAGSPVWNSILKARDVLRDGYVGQLGNGELSFWYSPWFTLGPLCDHVLAVNIHDVDLKIRDLFYHNQWQLARLYTPLPDHIREHITNTNIFLHDQVPDKIVWERTMEGVYSSKAGYKWIIQERGGSNHTLVWSEI